MRLPVCCLLFLLFCPSMEMVNKPRWKLEEGQNIVNNFKRHSEGTFTSDFTHYLDKIKAKDFVEWLASDVTAVSTTEKT